MSETTKMKESLPKGWVMKYSKSYKDRAYYFNVNTGVSRWEFPKLVETKDVKVKPESKEKERVKERGDKKDDRKSNVKNETTGKDLHKKIESQSQGKDDTKVKGSDLEEVCSVFLGFQLKRVEVVV
jgi:hypothetical protein